MLPMEPGSLVMERKMPLGIMQRAEKLATDRRVPIEQACIASGIELLEQAR